jgi:HemK-like putative methylase
MKNEEMWILKEKYNGIETEGFRADCARLADGEPLAYIIGNTPFLGTTIYLDSHPLIPRPETEYWVEKSIQTMKQYDRGFRVFDLCAGSGCIGTAVLAAIPNAYVDFCEIDTDHHETIQKNIGWNHIDPLRTRIYGGDLFEEITSTYDFILSNPPYIDPQCDRTEMSVRAYEPSIALYGGKDGLDIIHRIIAGSVQHLNENGVLILEHEPEQVEKIRQCGSDHGFRTTAEKDQYGVMRYTVLARGMKETMAP